MKELNIKDIQEVSKGILEKFDEICIENGLRYSIAYGTLLGAVRHGGFIPWDDDIDVVMPRDDYNRFINLEFDDGHYEAKSYQHTKGYYYSFCKMIDKTTYLKEHYRVEKAMGVFMDIFPLDYIASEDEYTKIWPQLRKERNVLFRNGYLITKDTTPSKLKYVERKALRLSVLPFRKMILSKYEKRHLGTPSDDYMASSFAVYQHDVIPVDFWNHLTRMKFEDIEVNAFSEYDSYLKKIYGDYMILPPEDKRISIHDFDAYYLE